MDRPRGELGPDARSLRRRAVRRAAAQRSRADHSTLRLTTLLLDIGGVVVPTLFEVTDTLPPGPFGDDERYAEVEGGRLQEREYWAEVTRARPELDIGEIMRQGLTVRAEVRSLLTGLGGRVKLAALTNDMAHWFGEAWPQRFPEFADFELLLEAGRSGVLKPDPAVFRWALQQLAEHDPARCLFVDDLPSNLRGAAAAGMAVQHFDVTDPVGSTRRVVERFGLHVSPTAPRAFRAHDSRAAGR